MNQLVLHFYCIANVRLYGVYYGISLLVNFYFTFIFTFVVCDVPEKPYCWFLIVLLTIIYLTKSNVTYIYFNKVIYYNFINNNDNNDILNFYKKQIFLKPLWRTLLLHFTVTFYYDSLCCIIPRCLRKVWLFHPNSVFYCIIFFVIFSTFIEMHTSHIFVNNLNTSPQERICHISLLLNIVCLDVSVGLYFFNLMSFTVLQSFLWIPLLSVTKLQILLRCWLWFLIRLIVPNCILLINQGEWSLDSDANFLNFGGKWIL